MYIHKNIIYQVIENPIQMCDSECLWIKIKNFEVKFTLGVVYRHPRTQTADQFLKDFFKCLDCLNKHSKYYYIWGDFNITLEIEKNIPLLMRYLNMLISYGAFPLITKPTRVTKNSSSIIDHIISNDIKYPILPGIFETCKVCDPKVESSRTSLASRTHFEVLGLGLEASSPWPWPQSLRSSKIALSSAREQHYF